MDCSTGIHPLHVVLGDSGAGCVRAACTSFGMPGTLFGFSDDLTHGPLDNRDARLAYLHGLATGGGGDVPEPSLFFSEWKAFHDCLRVQRPEAVIVWHSINVGDAIFVALACHQLGSWPGCLMHAQLPGVGGRPFVAMHTPAEIAQFFTARQTLSTSERLAFGQEYERIRDTCGPVRWLQNGKLVSVPINQFDTLLLAACGTDWRPAMHVVGDAMRQCEGPNLLSDSFFVSRLSSLIEQGQVEVSGLPSRLRQCAVRVPKALGARPTSANVSKD